MWCITGYPLFHNNLYYRLELVPGLLLVLVAFVLVLLSTSPLKVYLAAGTGSLAVIGFFPYTLDLYFTIESPIWERIINYPPFSASVGFCLENFCFAMALAYRTRLSEKEKQELQRNYSSRIEHELATRTSEIEIKSRELEAQMVKQLTAEFEQQLQATEMTALRAQMNPHFIFNCLNSMKLYTLENSPATAADYLTRFSRLIRLVLENSQYDKVSLADELETLQLYVDMETMRFKTKFRYEQQVEKNIDTGFVEIPPMLIQPYIENAIWHGLMHKEERGTLTLAVTQPNDETILVEIRDDGIGREKAAVYKSKSATKHKSFGLQMTSERIALINHGKPSKTQIHIDDLLDAHGNVAGTKVILTIPL